MTGSLTSWVRSCPLLFVNIPKYTATDNSDKIHAKEGTRMQHQGCDSRYTDLKAPVVWLLIKRAEENNTFNLLHITYL